MKASVILPIYNQVERLAITLSALNRQTIGNDNFEVIVVDDGSVTPISESFPTKSFDFPLQILRQENKGRAIARNEGVQQANTPLIIFCDADRVPGKEFVEKHIEAHNRWTNSIVIGNVREVYLSNLESAVPKFAEDPDYLMKRSKVPGYPRMMSLLFDADGSTDSDMPWISTFSGNMSLPKKLFHEVGGFSEAFQEWGFEHFELGFRLHNAKFPFYMQRDAVNYHLAHARDTKMMQTYINKSIQLMSGIHDCHPVIQSFGEFMSGNRILQDVEPNHQAKWLTQHISALQFAVAHM